MDLTDSTPGAPALHPTWTAMGHRLAAALGAGTALFGLLRHVPVHLASLRGALAWLAVLALFRVGRVLLEQSPAPEGPPTEDADEAESPRTENPA